MGDGQETYLLIQTLGFVTGTALFVVLTALSWKSRRMGDGTFDGLLASVGGLIWNAGNVARYAMLIKGVSPQAPPVLLAEAVAYTGTAIIPSAIMMMLWSATRRQPARLRPNPWLRYISYALALLLSLSFILSVAAGFPPDIRSVMKLSAFNLVLHVTVLIIIFGSPGEAANEARTYSFVMLSLMKLLALILLLLLSLNPGPSLRVPLTVLAQQSSIPMAIATFVFFGRFRFADVFVKRSLTILAAVFIASVYALLVTGPLAEAIGGAAFKHSLAGARAANVILWCVPLLLFPRLMRGLSRLADRWLFRRPDYKRLAQDFSRQVEPLEDEQELFAEAEQVIQSALDVTAKVIPSSAAEAQSVEAKIAPGSITQLPPDHPTPNLPGGQGIELIVPIEADGRVTHLFAIAPGARGRKLLSDEMAFLLALAERTGRTVESLRFQRERRERQIREERLQHLLTQAELRALRSQVNPHFLFNTLNTIADLVTTEPAKAEVMIERLAEVFRYSLTRADRNLITVGEEFEFLRTYMEIEQVRFGSRLRVVFDMSHKIANALIPSLILQPLVENAIKHGLAPRPGGGSVRVSALDDREQIRLVVEDDGVGCGDARGQKQGLFEGKRAEAAGLKGHEGGIGLSNVKERLRAMYGDHAAINVESRSGAGTTVVILLPKDETQNINHRRRSVGAVSPA